LLEDEYAGPIRLDFDDLKKLLEKGAVSADDL